MYVNVCLSLCVYVFVRLCGGGVMHEGGSCGAVAHLFVFGWPRVVLAVLMGGVCEDDLVMVQGLWMGQGSGRSKLG